MKIRSIIILALTLVFTVSCENNDEYEIVNVASPEYMSLTAFRNSVEIKSPVPVVESGKIYVYNEMVFVNDNDRGVHVIDNSNPKNPEKIAFIKVKANKDMEVKGSYLYVDSLMDLIVFDISDINNIKQVARLKDVFPGYIPMPFIENLVYNYGETVPSNDDIIVKWTIKEERRRVEDIDDYTKTGGIVFNDMVALASSESTGAGQGGSLARFKIVNEYLYAVDSHNINIFDIQNLEQPRELEEVYAGFDIETIFNRGNQLFLGSMSGMYIYDISSPAMPKFISEFSHGTACDPVVVDDKYAYITLRAGNFCGAFESSLEIVDVSDVNNLELVKSYPMENPYGLGVKENLLFICDGASGLKVYDKSNVNSLQLLNHFENINTFDVIPTKDNLLLIGDKILFQYTYSTTGIDLLSEFHLN